MINQMGLPEMDTYSAETTDAIIRSTAIHRNLRKIEDNMFFVKEALREVKRAGITKYDFAGEDYVSLNVSIGVYRKLGIDGGFIMDRSGNVYYTFGVGSVMGASAGIATGKFKVDTTGWRRDDYYDAIAGKSVFSGYTVLITSAAITLGKRAAREMGISSAFGLSVSATENNTIYICNINEL